MTVSKMREYMTEKVIPEKVLPQNITAFLMDENAELPELDAYTFLNRLRALGIGSADFLYLLEGCGAPDECVRKIKQNPAMNLQALIVTLEGSGLSPQDYTRMLYTARQLWERTLTMRLDDPVEQTSAVEVAEESLDTEEVTEQETEIQELVSTEEEPVEEEQELSAEEDSVAEGPQYDEQIEEQPSDEQIEEQENDEPEATEKREEFVVEIREEPEVQDELWDYQPKPKEQKKVTIDDVLTGRQRPKRVQYDDGTSEFVHIDPTNFHIDIPDDDDDPTPVETEEQEERIPAKRHKGAIIGSAVGAAALVGLCAYMEIVPPPVAEKPLPLAFAVDNMEVFSAVYNAYSGGNIGGEPVPVAEDNGVVYGNMLVQSLGQLGVYHDGDNVYCSEDESIEVYSRNGSKLERVGEILPPDGTEFIKVFSCDDGVYAVFSGEDCGFMKLDGDKSEYIVTQDGRLTDMLLTEGQIMLGSVYAPDFAESFTVEQTEHYLPAISGVVLPPQNVVLSRTDGCAYAVSAGYNLADGAVERFGAVMGDALYASADGTMAVLDTPTGAMLVDMHEGAVPVSEEIDPESSESIQTESVTLINTADSGEVLACDYENGLLATIEKTAEGTVVCLRNGLDAAAMLTNFDREPATVSISDNVLYISDEDGLFMTVDCSSPTSPQVMELKAVQGLVQGEYALCTEKNASGIRIVLYSLTEDEAAEISSYSKNLTAAELETLSFGGANSAFIESAERGGMAYSYFDGVSVVSEYSVLGKQRHVKTLFDDRTGYTAAADINGELFLFSGEGALLAE